MAGIFGCYIRNSRFEAKSIIAVLQRHALTGFSHKTEFKTFYAEAVGLGYAARHSSADSEIFSSDDDNFSLVLSGELFLPSGDQLNSINFITEFLPHFEKKGKEFFLHCDGAFVLALYNKAKKSLYLVTDPFGNLALHYAHSEQVFLFSLQQKALAEILQDETDEEAISEIIALGQRLNGKTVYKNIFRLPPASFLIIDRSGELSLSKYFRPDFNEGSNRKESLQLVEQSLLRSLDIRTRRSGIIVALSGGLDSRMTLAAIHKLDRTNSITAFTHGLPDSGDMSVASRITNSYNISHLRINFDDSFLKSLSEYWQTTIHISEGGLGIESSANIPSWIAESEKFTVSLDSHAGALYRRQFHKARERYVRRSKNFPKAFFDHFASALFHSELISSQFREAAMNSGMNAFNEYFSSQSANLDIGDRIDLYYLEQICANKYSLSGNAQLNYIGLSHPLLSLAAYSAATHIPARERKKNIIYRYLFNRFAPELKYFWTDDSGYPVPYFGYRTLRYAAPLLQRGLQVLPEYFQKFSPKKPVLTRMLIAGKNIQTLKEILLEHTIGNDSVFSSQILEREISDFEKGKKNNAETLIQAANLKLLLEYYTSRS